MDPHPDTMLLTIGRFIVPDDRRIHAKKSRREVTPKVVPPSPAGTRPAEMGIDDQIKSDAVLCRGHPVNRFADKAAFIEDAHRGRVV